MANMPKRRKSNDNPYVLDYREDINIYTIKFKDNKNVLQVIEVTEEVYKVFDKAELEDISQMHEYERHIEHSELTDITLNKRAVKKILSVEEQVENLLFNEEIKSAIDSLSEVQKSRIIKYYFEGKNEYEIAKEENTSQQAIHKSLTQAKQKLKEILKKFNI